MSATRDLQDDLLEAQQAIVAISVWLDDYPPNKAKDPLAAFLLRFMKVFEEAGEMVGEIIGMTGQNPRKGVTSDLEKVLDEACDVIITMLGAIETATQNQGEAFPRLFEKIEKVHDRMQALPSADEIPSDVKIDKFLDREPMQEKVHDHSDTDPWSKDGFDRPTAYIDGCVIETVGPPD